MKTTYSAGGIVVGPGEKILVVNQNGNSWSLPKGHIDPGEDALTAARREIYEESGVSELGLVSDLGSYSRFKIGKGGQGDDEHETKNIHMFQFRTSQETLKPIDPLNPEAKWVEKGKVASLLTHPKDKHFFEGWLKCNTEK
ncbi:MAG: NUDIX domain-containing protein [Candidatus Aenigmarchaeota archaeon]|nr:NUDIX domain-containing protein [Candidatus Aenigmarchaeota archaeon]